MKKGFLITLVVFLPLALAFLPGCSALQRNSGTAVPSAFNVGQKKSSLIEMQEQYRIKALEHERMGDLPKAIKNWEIIKSFRPSDAQAEERISLLRNQIPTAAEMHFRKGVSFFQTHSYNNARKELLFSLYLNPDHDQALFYLKKLSGEDLITYDVQKGDTIMEVAIKVYGDPEKDFLVAYFNGLKADSSIKPPLTLKMPLLDISPSKKIVHGNEVQNASQYQLAKELSEGKKYADALKVFQRIDPNYRDVRSQIAFNRRQLAEVHYIEGVKYFVAEEIEKAIKEWESTLALEPNHPKAKRDIETGQSILKKLKSLD